MNSIDPLSLILYLLNLLIWIGIFIIFNINC